MRNDIHQPSKMDPDDYVELMWFGRLPVAPGQLPIPPMHVEEALAIYAERGAKIHGGLFNCDLCGASYNHGSLFRHNPTGEVISVGHICADKVHLLRDRAGADESRESLRAVSLRARERAAKRANLWAWARENRELLPLLRMDHEVAKDMRGRLIDSGARWGLSDAQAGFLRGLARRRAEEAEMVWVDAPEGRLTVQGTVLAVKVQESAYGSTLKMLVRVDTAEGSWKLWTTVPAAMLDQVPTGPGLRGAVVGLVVTVTRGREKGFAIGKRPFGWVVALSIESNREFRPILRGWDWAEEWEKVWVARETARRMAERGLDVQGNPLPSSSPVRV